MNVVDEKMSLVCAAAATCGCLEQVASATGVVKLAKRMLEETDKETSLRSLPEVSAKSDF